MDRPEDRLCLAAEELAAGRCVVRAIIVKTWGSTPREVGADMLLSQDGSLYGTVGGGCGEAEVYELAQEMLGADPTAPGYLYHVDLTESPEFGGEKVCGGRFDVLLYRLDSEFHTPLIRSLNAQLSQGGQRRWCVRAGTAQPGFWKQGQSSLALEPELFFDDGECAEPSWESHEQGGCFYEPLGKRLRLVIVGAGHIARPLCRLASEVGYQVSVIDDREDYAQQQFFPEAFEIISGEYDKELPRLATAPGTSVVLVTRGHKHDQDCLRLMAGLSLDYLGMIGSQRRIDAVYTELIEEGVARESLSSVYAPIGLEIGARTPSEIAVSILAQMIKVRRTATPKSSSRAAEDRRRYQRSLRG